MPSLWEGLGIAAIEAQASGLKTIVSDKFPMEVKVTDKVVFLPLALNEWIRKINGFQDRVIRIDESEFIKKAGYDMSNSAEIIHNVYCEK